MFAHESVLHFAPLPNWPAMEDFGLEAVSVESLKFKEAISMLKKDMPIIGNIADLEFRTRRHCLPLLRRLTLWIRDRAMEVLGKLIHHVDEQPSRVLPQPDWREVCCELPTA
jgi:hypothetical protein